MKGKYYHYALTITKDLRSFYFSSFFTPIERISVKTLTVQSKGKCPILTNSICAQQNGESSCSLLYSHEKVKF